MEDKPIESGGEGMTVQEKLEEVANTLLNRNQYYKEKEEAEAINWLLRTVRKQQMDIKHMEESESNLIKIRSLLSKYEFSPGVAEWAVATPEGIYWMVEELHNWYQEQREVLEFYADKLGVRISMGHAFPSHESIKYDKGEKSSGSTGKGRIRGTE